MFFQCICKWMDLFQDLRLVHPVVVIPRYSVHTHLHKAENMEHGCLLYNLWMQRCAVIFLWWSNDFPTWIAVETVTVHPLPLWLVEGTKKCRSEFDLLLIVVHWEENPSQSRGEGRKSYVRTNGLYGERCRMIDGKSLWYIHGTIFFDLHVL